MMRPSPITSPVWAGAIALSARALLLALVAFAAAFLAMPAAAQTFPKFTGLVVDDAGVLPAAVQADLTQKLAALQRDTKRQLVIVTVKDTQGYPLEEYGYRLGRTWGVGLRDVNNGIVLFIAPDNPAGHRGPRIEVGYGLEPIMTDALSSVIAQNEMVPLIRAGKVPEAIEVGADAIIAQLRASPEEAQARLNAAVKQFDETRRAQHSGSGGLPIGLIFWGMVLLFVLLSFARRGSGTRYNDGSGALPIVLWSIANEISRGAGGGGGWGGGGGGSDGGGWGGGGFTGGGGGSFGGGGASGDW